MNQAATQDAPADTANLQVTREIARHLCALRYDAIPTAAVEGAKRFMLDTLAVAWAGTDAPGCPPARGLLVPDGNAGGECTVWGSTSRASAESAAFLNGLSAAALDFDSLQRDSPSHVNVSVLPAAVAMAERQHVSGKTLLTALVAGCDLMCRLGAASEALGQKHRGWFYTSVHGVISAAAAAGKILVLNEEKMLSALGLAYSQAGGTQQVVVEPGLGKRLGSGFAARGGVFSALLAAHGLSGPKASLEGAYGLFNMYQPVDSGRLLRNLGRDFDNANLSIKKFPTCGCNHTTIDAALWMTATQDLKPGDITDIEVVISEFMDRIVGRPFEPGDDPQVSAQFNIRYSIACALTRRRFGLAEIDADTIADPAILALAQKVKVTIDPDNRGKRGPAVLRVQSRRHGLIERKVDYVPGSAQSPLSADDIEAKSRECFSRGAHPLDAARTQRLIDRVNGLEDVADVATLFEGVV
ncbi:MAG: MmgE/PrpD family protein [Burkholderiales bacterium]